MDDFFEMYEDMICSKICKFSGELCEDGSCKLAEAVQELKQEYAIKVLSGEV